jgi:pyridoxamine 5'-phosphate oxidase
MNVIRNKSLRQLVANFRNEYLEHGIDEHRMLENPIDQFEVWFHEAVKNKLPEPNALHLVTATTDGKPSGRVMLLKGYDENGFIFFTNYQSRKGQELDWNQHAAITFLWLELIRSVRIEGIVSKVSEAESDEYFQSRPRKSQIGAWVSEQSNHLHNRKDLDERFKETEKLFKGKPIARPPHWGGYRLKPHHIEFWQGRASRLHDRILYTLEENGVWNRQRLFP